ncbi:MAG: vanadium-dependent haloperoxidase [Bacteroidota bacterium]
MAYISRQFFESTSAANLSAIDSLEAVYKTRFSTESSADKVTNAENYGVQVATSIFNWSKTDGADQAYNHVTDPNYVVPVGPGLWVPTSAQLLPICPHWGNNRSFITNIAQLTQPGPPTAYSEDPKSPFYQMVNELYTISLSLTHEDSIIAKFWGDQPGNLNVPAHATNILKQLIVLKKMNLYDAAAAYAIHGIALNDASISVFRTKYTYNLLRPVSYIRNVMKIAEWNTVIPTPPHPEYSAAHAVISAASAVVLENIFGKNFKFTDHSYDNSYGARSFNSFDDYAKEAGKARLLAGLHFSPSIAKGLTQGRKIGEMVNRLQIKK